MSVSDNFDDNKRNTSLWDEFSYRGGVVQERQGRLLLQVNGGDQAAGYVTVDAWNIRNGYVKCDVIAGDLRDYGIHIGIQISKSKILDNHPYWHLNFYRIIYNFKTSNLMISKCINGYFTELVNTTISGIKSLRIRELNNTLFFEYYVTSWITATTVTDEIDVSSVYIYFHGVSPAHVKGDGISYIEDAEITGQRISAPKPTPYEMSTMVNMIMSTMMSLMMLMIILRLLPTMIKGIREK